MIPRHENPIMAVLAIPDLAVSLIADGAHLPEEFLRTAFLAKSNQNLVMVSDQTHLTGMPPGHYYFGDTPVILDSNRKISLVDNSYLAGSAKTLAQCLETLWNMKFVNCDDLYRMAYYNPLSMLGLITEIEGDHENGL
jgi:N-acetylglucosamine-6-phosphate deacetylase